MFRLPWLKDKKVSTTQSINQLACEARARRIDVEKRLLLERGIIRPTTLETYLQWITVYLNSRYFDPNDVQSGDAGIKLLRNTLYIVSSSDLYTIKQEAWTGADLAHFILSPGVGLPAAVTDHCGYFDLETGAYRIANKIFVPRILVDRIVEGK